MLAGGLQCEKCEKFITTMNMPKIERALRKDVGRSWREGNMFLVKEFMMVLCQRSPAPLEAR